MVDPSKLQASTQDYQPGEGIGSHVGPYKLLQQIGEGGMGVVFMAEQEQPVRRRVALKVIKPGMDSSHVIARFRAEQQALALMDHQHIAKVYDAGMTEQGRPYFVMELVHGVPITKYCDDNKLSPRERLELFVPVCRAVQHAHQKGILHRDLKPSNVLVCLYDGKPVAKVIDFGVAKAMEQPLTDATMFTQFGQVVGTLEYMSPEQAEMSQLGIDTRSDIYSLGVMLYELLTGTTPLQRQRIKKAAFDEVLKLIREEEPPPPSSRLSSSTESRALISQQRRMEPAQLTRFLRGELDWIVMKTLEKDRTRRYGTADGLGRDIERYLSDEPVEAGPPSMRYRLGKYAHKHRVLLGTAAAFVLLLVAGAAISTWQAVRATVAEGVADKAKTDAVADRDKARRSEEQAVHARDEARQSRDDLKAASDKLRQTLYVSDMMLVRAAWDSDQPERALGLLERHRPKAGDRDLRGFEWFYWKRKIHGASRRIQLEGFIEQEPLKGSFAFSQDGALFASIQRAKEKGFELRVWHTATGKVFRSIPLEDTHQDANPGSYGITFLTDHRCALIAVRDSFGNRKGVPLHNIDPHSILSLDTKKTLYKLTDDKVFFHPDGKRLVTLRSKSKGDEVDLVWRDASTGRETKTLRVPSLGIALSQDLNHFAFPVPHEKDGMYRDVHVFDSFTGKVLQKLPLPEAFELSFPLRNFPLCFSADGKRLAVGPAERPTKVRWPFNQPEGAAFFPLTYWDLESSKLLWTRPLPPAHSQYKVMLSPAGGTVLVSHLDGRAEKLILLDGSSGEFLAPLAPLAHGLRRQYVFSPNGEFLVGPRDVGFQVLATQSGRSLFIAKDLSYPTRLQFRGDGTELLVFEDTDTIRSWGVADWLDHARLSRIPPPDALFPPCALYDDGKWIVAVDWQAKGFQLPDPNKKQRLNIINAHSGKLVQSFEAQKGKGSGSIFRYVDTTGPGIVLRMPGQQGFEIRQIDPESDRPRVSWHSPSEPGRAIFMEGERHALIFMRESRKGREFAKGRGGLAAYFRPVLIDLATGAKVASDWDRVKDLWPSAQSSRDGRRVVYQKWEGGKGTKGFVVAETTTARILLEIADTGLRRVHPWLSPDGRRVVILGDNTFQMYDVATGQLRFSVKEPGFGPAAIVVFSPDGRRLCVFGRYASGQYTIWDDNGNELLRLETNIPLDSWPIFSQDGHRLMAVRHGWETLQPNHYLEIIDATPLPGDEPVRKKDTKVGP